MDAYKYLVPADPLRDELKKNMWEGTRFPKWSERHKNDMLHKMCFINAIKILTNQRKKHLNLIIFFSLLFLFLA